MQKSILMVGPHPDHPPGIATGFGSRYSQSLSRQIARPYRGGSSDRSGAYDMRFDTCQDPISFRAGGNGA